MPRILTVKNSMMSQRGLNHRNHRGIPFLDMFIAHLFRSVMSRAKIIYAKLIEMTRMLVKKPRNTTGIKLGKNKIVARSNTSTKMPTAMPK